MSRETNKIYDSKNYNVENLQRCKLSSTQDLGSFVFLSLLRLRNEKSTFRLEAVAYILFLLMLSN